MAGTLRLSKITFKAGPAPGKSYLEIQPGTVLVFVGPNNSGKSLSLHEIENWCFGQDRICKIIDSLQVDFPTDPKVAENLLRQFQTTPPQGHGETPGTFWIGQHTFREDQQVRHLQISIESLKDATTNTNLNTLRQWLSASYTVRLDGRTRFLLADPKPTGDLQLHPQNHLWALFKDAAARERVRKLTAEAFGLYFVIDPTAMRTFRIGMSSRAPKTESEEQSLDDTARNFHAQAQPIANLSDGVQAFVGLVSAILSLPHKIVLVDEPDAFLHPPLARRLAGNLAEVARDRDASLVVATHSSEFVIGCLEAVEQTSVVRLTYEGGIATARALSSQELSTMIRDPLLRSTEVLRALFHRAAVVTEADSDRAFYDEMNRRLLSGNRGVKDAIFLNAQNKQTVHRLVAPLRRIGIPAAAIVDLDILSEGGTVWQSLLNACQINVGKLAAFEAEREYLHNIFSTIPIGSDQKPAIKGQGLKALKQSDHDRAIALLNELSCYGLFVVPLGEVESWLSHLSAKGHGSEWLVDLFSRIGHSESEPNYLKPGQNDVWQFLDKIANWVNNPSRQGTD